MVIRRRLRRRSAVVAVVVVIVVLVLAVVVSSVLVLIPPPPPFFSSPSNPQMKYRYGVHASTLHVRCSNKAAQKLYLGSLGYRIVQVVPQYYQDGADAYYMQVRRRRKGP